MNKGARIGVVVLLLLGVGIAALLWMNPDLGLRLRSQVVVPTEGPSSITKQLTWTPGNNVPVGDKTITFTANDGRGGIATENAVITVEGLDVGINDVVITPEDVGARIAWRTNALARRPRVNFDLNDELKESEEKADETETNDHEVVLTGLVPCTTYTLRIAALSSAQEIQGNLRVFTTTGCVGAAPVRGTGMGEVPSGQETTIALSDKVSVVMPAGAMAADGHMQIHQLDRDVAMAAIGSPQEGLLPVTGLYEMSAYADAKTAVTSFDQPLTVRVGYTPAADTDVSTVALWRHDGTNWSPLTDCVVDESAQTVSCTTTQFSAVAGFATGGGSGDEEPEPEPEPQPASGGGGDGGDSGGGGGDDSGGGGEAEASLPSARGFVYQVEQGWSVTGKYSGVQGNAVKIAAGSDLLSHTITAPSEDYYFYIKARHDRPGPVMAAVYVAPRGGRLRAWKTVRLDKNDDKYYAHQLGVLSARDFPGGVYQIGIRLLNDTYDKNDPSNEATDRNLWVDWVILANRPSLSQVRVVDRSTSSSAVGGSGSSVGNGILLLPALNGYMRSEGIAVTVDNWKYYAWRLTRPSGHPAAIRSETELRTVMRYWVGVSPDRPRGEIIN